MNGLLLHRKSLKIIGISHLARVSSACTWRAKSMLWSPDLAIRREQTQVLPWPGPGERAMAFAQAIRRRYQGRPGLWPLLGLVFRRSQAGGAAYHLSSHVQLQVAPRLTLAWGTPTVSAGPSLERIVESHVVGAPPVRIVPVQPRLEIRLDRLTTREIRLESVTAAGVVPSPVKATTPAGLPVPRVVRRAAAEATPSPQPSPAALSLPGRPAAPSFSTWPPAGAPSPVTLSPGEVNRLTDQVLQVLDRRMTAHRERLGRG